MDVQRAQQILNSKETIEVLHHGSPVWIESVAPEKNTARVRNLSGNNATSEIPVTELTEG